MSTLESKAKTTNEILIYVHDAKGFIGIVPHQGDKLVEYGNQKWVLLEEAQKLDNQAKNAISVALETTEKLQKAEAKIVETNKILDESSCLNGCCPTCLKRLREVLK